MTVVPIRPRTPAPPAAPPPPPAPPAPPVIAAPVRPSAAERRVRAVALPLRGAPGEAPVAVMVAPEAVLAMEPRTLMTLFVLALGDARAAQARAAALTAVHPARRDAP